MVMVQPVLLLLLVLMMMMLMMMMMMMMMMLQMMMQNVHQTQAIAPFCNSHETDGYECFSK